MSISSLLPLFLLIASSTALFEDVPLPAADNQQISSDLRQKIVETCNFPSESMTVEQYSLCTKLVAILRVQLLSEQEKGEIPLEKRKASFIRFGKRSSPLNDDDESSLPQKRKASFIRFGRR